MRRQSASREQLKAHNAKRKTRIPGGNARIFIAHKQLKVLFMGQPERYNKAVKKKITDDRKGACSMRGYFTASGFYGLVNGRYRLFASETDYFEAMEDDAAE